MMKLYCARWVLPMAGMTIEDGGVAVEGAHVVAVGARAELTKKFPEARIDDFGEAVILPGLVNCHSHLELTVMRGFLESVEGDFFAWLRKLTVAKLERMTADDLYVSATWGAVEAVRAGITCVGDASDFGSASLAALRDVGLRGIVYQEVFGPDAGFAREQLENLQEKVQALRSGETSLVRIGVSPHAPYTVSGPLLELITDYALAERLPLMMHAAESIAEREFMLYGAGPFAEGLARRGIEWQAPKISTVQYLSRLGLLGTQPLLAHCITVDQRDIETIKEYDASVAHCPKSNAKLGHGRAPFESFLENEITVGFGSDSVASNNRCDILEEARFATLLSRTGPSGLKVIGVATADAAFRTATSGGARALGLEAQTGELIAGMQADLIAVSLNGLHQLPFYDLATALIFSSSGHDVLLTVVGGKEIYRDGRVLSVDEERLRERVKEISRRLAGD